MNSYRVPNVSTTHTTTHTHSAAHSACGIHSQVTVFSDARRVTESPHGRLELATRPRVRTQRAMHHSVVPQSPTGVACYATRQACQEIAYSGRHPPALPSAAGRLASEKPPRHPHAHTNAWTDMRPTLVPWRQSHSSRRSTPKNQDVASCCSMRTPPCTSPSNACTTDQSTAGERAAIASGVRRWPIDADRLDEPRR